MKFSIIIPVYNAERYIENAVYSILKQSFDDYEVILVDDGSSDQSHVIVDKLISDHSRVKGIHISNHGVSYARNIGVNMACGDYILFMDSDDKYEEGILSRLSQILNIYPDVDVLCFGYIEDVIENGKSIKQTLHHFPVMHLTEIDSIKKHSLKLITDPMFGSVWSKMYKKSLLDEYKIRMPEQLFIGEDYCFNLDVLSHCREWMTIEDPLYRYMIQNESSIIRRYNSEKFEQMYRMHLCRKAFIDHYSTAEIEEKNAQIRANYIRLCMSCFMDLSRRECKMSHLEKLKYIRKLKCTEEEQYNKKYLKYLSTSYKIIYILYNCLGARGLLFLSKICYWIKFYCGINI